MASLVKTATAIPLMALAAFSIFVAGCANDSDPAPVMSDDDHDHHHGGHGHPENLPDAVHELVELRDTVRDAFAADDSETAHGPLHDVGHLLEEVKELAGKADVSDEAKETISKNADSLMEAFGSVDKAMHEPDGDPAAAYKEVSGDIDTAVEQITEAAGSHDHDHGEHEDDHGDEDHDHAEDENSASDSDE